MNLQTEEEEACRIEDAWAGILDAFNKARSKHSPCNSVYEGLTFIRFEMLEIEEAVKERQIDVAKTRKELMHTIVCCLRTDAALVAQANGEAFLKRRDKE